MTKIRTDQSQKEKEKTTVSHGFTFQLQDVLKLANVAQFQTLVSLVWKSSVALEGYKISQQHSLPRYQPRQLTCK